MMRQNISVRVHENALKFSAQGHGAKGLNHYEFTLPFLLPVKPEVSAKSTQRQVNLTVRKERRGWWERLSGQERRPAFLVPDFDRWLEESDAELEIREEEEKKKRLKRLRNQDNGFSVRTGFLFLYNLLQFLCFSWIFINMNVRLVVHGPDSLYDTFRSVSDVMFFCQIFAVVEVLNAAFGVVRTGVVPTLIQVVGRNFVLFILLGVLEEMQNRRVVFFVFYLWSAAEIFRYPFDMLGCLGVEWKVLTWLRYSAWIPLFPLGALAEAVAVVQSAPVLDEYHPPGVPLPAGMGGSLRLSRLLYVYLLLMLLGLIVNLRHLYKQRRRRFRSKRRKAN